MRFRAAFTATVFATLQIAIPNFTMPCASAAQSVVQLCCSNIIVSPEGAFSTHLTIQPPAAAAVTVYGRIIANYGTDLGKFKAVIAPGQIISPEVLFQDKQLTNGGTLELTEIAGNPKAALGILITAHLAAPPAVWFPGAAYNTGYISDEGLTEITLFASEHESPLHVTLRQLSGERRDPSGARLELFTQEIEIPRYQLGATVQVPDIATAAQFTLESSNDILVDKSAFNAVFPPPTLYFTVQSLYVSAGSTVTLFVHRSGDPFPAVTVDYRTTDDTLKAGIDYVGQRGRLEFAPGERIKSILIPLFHEPRGRDLGHSFLVALNNPVNASLSYSNVPIIFARTIDFSSQTCIVDSNGDATLNFSISHPLTDGVDISISFYNLLSHGYFVLEVPAGKTEFSTTLSLPDLQWPLTVGLAVLSSLDIFPGAFSRAEIRPHDWTPDLNLIRVSSSLISPGDPVYFHMQRLGPTNTPLELMFSTQDGTARAGINYIPTNGVIHFAPGADSVDVLVATLLNQEIEDEKQFSLSLDNLPPNVSLSGGQLTGRIAPTNPDYQLLNTALSEGSEMTTVSLASNLGEISFNFSTIEGTAKAGVDFVPVTGSFNNVTSADIKIPILDDAEVEAPESFTLVIVETAPQRRTNSFEIIIFDNEIPFNHDDSFTVADHYNFSIAGVMKDDRIVIVEWPTNIHLLDRNGVKLSTSPIVNLFSANDEFSLLALTPQGELLVAQKNWQRVLGNTDPLRIRTDGTLDETFHPDLPFGIVSAIIADDQGRLYVGMNALGAFDWTVLRLNHDGSRDYSFPRIQPPGRGAEVYQLSLAGPNTLEVIGATYYYRYTAYYRLMIKNGIIEAEKGQGFPFWEDPSEFFNGVYVGKTGDKIVHQAPPGSYMNILYRRKADVSIDPSLKVGMFDGQPGYIGTQSDGKIIAYDDTLNPSGSFVRLGPGTTVSTNVVKIGNFDNRRSEGDGRFEIKIFRLGDSSQRISVRTRTENGTARAGLDYLPIDQTLVFEPYEVSKAVYIPILQDSIVEGDETLFLTLGEPALGTRVDGNPYLLTLTDVDYCLLQLQMYGNEGYIWVDNRTNRKIELQSSDDGGRTWQKAADAETYPSLRIDFSAQYRIYRGVVRED